MKKILVLLINFYRLFHVAFFSDCCRFHPTCSRYAIEAIEGHGVLKGIFLAFLRILKCNPFSKGGWDPVPENKPLAKKCIEGENCG